MPFDGSGNFNRALGPDTWQNDAAAGIKIKSDLHDNNDNDLASGLSLTITKDGQSSPTADITLNGHKLINVANPDSPQDAMTLNAFAAAAVRYDVAQVLTAAQQLVAHTNLAATESVAVKAGAYTLLQADRGKLIRITAAMTLTLPAASAVGNDFSVDFRTMGGTMTLAPNGTNQIEGVNANFLVNDLANGTIWCDGTNWWVGQCGVIKSVLITTSQSPWTKPKGCKAYRLRGVGPGGGGGATTTTVSDFGAGGGGGSGAYGETDWLNATAITTATIVIGAAGQGGTGSGGGTTGGTTTFNDGVRSLSWGGGTGGAGMPGNPSAFQRVGGIGGLTTGTFLMDFGTSGSCGFSASTTTIGGDGASSPFGRGGVRTVTTSHGSVASGFGAGGGGGCRSAAAGTSLGGDASAGALIMDMQF